MSEKPVVFTFHKIRAQCEGPDSEAWRAFLTFYGPLCLHLLAMYAPDTAIQDDLWKKTLTNLAEKQFERFRGTARQTEREFLADLRWLLLETLAGDGRAARTQTTKLDSENLRKLLGGLPFLHQEMLYLKLAGYGERTIEKMLRASPRVAEKTFERLSPDYAAAARIEKDRCAWPADWLAFLLQARAEKKDNCADLHEILRIHDGQVSWYEKEPVEKHVSDCLYCMERWTALREVGYWRKWAPPASDAQVDEWLRHLPVVVIEKKKSLLQRVFG